MGKFYSKQQGKKKELYEGLDIPLPEPETNIEYEEDSAIESEE